MRYSVATFDFCFAEQWQQDVFEQALCDLGFEVIDGNKAYIQTEMLNEQLPAIQSQIAMTEGVSLVGIEDCPDENWNATWEAEHPVQELLLGVRIIPHCAFGAGHHETTSMMIDELINQQSAFANQSVLDHGTGTGVLAIFAKKLGADYVLAIDIDDKSVQNARENAELNGVDIDVQIGSTPPSPSKGESESGYSLIMANIHRNILLANMQAYAECLAPSGQLWLSGFYEDDCPTLIAAAESYSLHHAATRNKADWRMLLFCK